MFVFVVLCNRGFYLEPDIELLAVCDRKKTALEFINKLRKREDGLYHKSTYWIQKKKINKGLN